MTQEAAAVLDAVIMNEPAQAVDTLQALIRTKAEEAVADAMRTPEEDGGADE